MKAWLIGVGILFVVAEFSIWLEQFILPFPLYVLGGAFLAIASNYEKGIMAMFRHQDKLDTDVLSQTATIINQANALESNNELSLPEVSEES